MKVSELVDAVDKGVEIRMVKHSHGVHTFGVEVRVTKGDKHQAAVFKNHIPGPMVSERIKQMIDEVSK